MTSTLTSTAAVRDRLLTLAERGLTPSHVARAAHVSKSLVQRIAVGTAPHARTHIVRALLDVDEAAIAAQVRTRSTKPRPAPVRDASHDDERAIATSDRRAQLERIVARIPHAPAWAPGRERYDDHGVLQWEARAMCARIQAPTWLFFPAVGDTGTVAAARTVCRACPVRISCRDAHLDDVYGFVGGTTERERRRLRVQRREVAA